MRRGSSLLDTSQLCPDARKLNFYRFVEDYNTATLPHSKFYNMASYERQMNSLRNGNTADVISCVYDPNVDMAVSGVVINYCLILTIYRPTRHAINARLPRPRLICSANGSNHCAKSKMNVLR